MTTNTKCVLAIGNFDGVHQGHAALLKTAGDIAADNQLPLYVLTFEPHPRTFFKPDTTPFRITLRNTKIRLLKAFASDVRVLDFNAFLAGMSAQQFINDIIVRDMNAAHVVVGQDFHFGKDRSGHIETLQADTRFKTTPISLIGDTMAAISSTRIRQALHDGNITEANEMLGWHWAIEGEVIHGDKRGREIGFPTANIPLGDTLCPAHGIYAVWVDIGDGKWLPGAANIGLRPMFALAKPLLEVYLLDWSGDLYGKTLKVRPVKHLRPEAKFEGLEALKAQIAKDCAAARDVLISLAP